jgi:hypothetical protein
MTTPTKETKQRFTRGLRCPVCNGSDGDQRGQGTRCHGFQSGQWVHCAREEFAGRAKFHEGTRTYAHRARGPCPCGVEHAPADQVSTRRNGKQIEAIYPYRDADGTILHETVRFRPKGFAQRRPNGSGGYVWNLEGVDRVIYNLPEILKADPSTTIYIVEGEKDADRLSKLGLLATTSPEGAGKWHRVDSSTLHGRRCVCFPDNDESGCNHAEQVAKSLYGKATEIKIVPIPGLPPKGDVSDFLDQGGTVEQLLELVEAVPAWMPERNGTADQVSAFPKPGSVNVSIDGKVDYSALDLDEIGLVKLSAIEERPIRWLWPYRLACGEMALIAGEGGVGKSQLLLWIAAAVSNGWPWPDGSGNAPIGDVVILSAEDDPSTTIKPRLKALGANLDRIYILTAKMTIKKRGKEPIVDLKSLQDRSYFRAVFDKLPNPILFVVDPVVSYLGSGIDDQKNAEVRKILEPFVEEVIRPKELSFFANTHLNKSVEVKNAVHRVTGSIAYVNIARNLHIVVRDPDKREQRFFVQAKCNNAPDDLPWIAYEIEKRILPTSDGEIETSVPVFSRELIRGRDLGQMVAGERGKRGPKSVVTVEAAHFLIAQLEPGRCRLTDLGDRARERGLLSNRLNKNGKLSLATLYDAKELIPRLRPGWQVANYKDDDTKFTYWELVQEPEQTGSGAAPF